MLKLSLKNSIQLSRHGADSKYSSLDLVNKEKSVQN